MNLLSIFSNEREVATYVAGQQLFAEGDAGDAMYVVIDGTIELSAGGRTIRQLGAGELFGEMALIDSGPRSATATARTDCRVVRVDERRFTFLVQQTPFFALHVMRVLAQRLRETSAKT